VAVVVRSALAQTIQDLEVIVVDDASDDETPGVLAALASEDARVRVVRPDARGGAGRARNAGAARAAGTVLAFLDDDCAWHPEKLEAQLAAMGPERGAAYTRQATLDVDGRWVLEGRPLPARPQIDGLLRTNFIGTPSLVVRKDVFDDVGGFDEQLPRLQDWDLALRIVRRTCFAFVPRVLVRSVMVSGGISTDAEPLERAAELVLERHAPHLTRRQLAALHYGLAKFLLVDGRTGAAQRLFREAIRLDPTSLLNWMGGAAGALGPAPARAIRALRRKRAVRRLVPGETGWSDVPAAVERPR
jgi:glycosyltransferase involved in cell wall biosynthesis